MVGESPFFFNFACPFCKPHPTLFGPLQKFNRPNFSLLTLFRKVVPPVSKSNVHCLMFIYSHINMGKGDNSYVKKTNLFNDLKIFRFSWI